MGRYLDLIRSLETKPGGATREHVDSQSRVAFMSPPERGANGRITPAESLMDTCHKYGVGLRVDPDGVLVVESYGRAWRSLIQALDAHADEITSLLVTAADGQRYALRRVEA